MEELVVVLLWVLGYAVLGPLCVVAVLGPPMLVARGLVRLGARVPGGLGRWVRARERQDPGTLAAALACVQVVAGLVALWTGLLGWLIRWASGAGG